MRGAKAKSLRRERPDHPHPGRKSGGSIGREASSLAAERRQRERMAAILSHFAQKPKEDQDG
jgi:hypothetical protein